MTATQPAYRAGAHYDTIADFYTDSNRKWSRECDYGVMWYLSLGRRRPWRVSYVELTGEVYATPTDGAGPVEVIGVITPNRDTRDTAAAGHGIPYYRTLDRVLKGWENPDISGRLLGWVICRLREAGGC